MTVLSSSMLRGFSSVASVISPEDKLPKISARKISIEDALREDWLKVGNDIKVSIKKFEHSLNVD